MRTKLITLRKAKGLSRLDMANAINKTVSFYGKIERGTRNPGIDDAKIIADTVGSTVDELFFGDQSDVLSQKLNGTE